MNFPKKLEPLPYLKIFLFVLNFLEQAAHAPELLCAEVLTPPVSRKIH